jgi:type II secretory ATPase GspE/PulE/Tfp pilus assembly ATPase PilB-like protein/ActR/RegA family two-component response regulator
LSHWLAQVAIKAGFPAAHRLVLDRDISLSDAWATTSDVCGLTAAELASAVAKAFRMGVADFSVAEPTAVKLIPGSIARKLGVFPIKHEDRYLIVATSDPTSQEIERDVVFVSGRSPSFVIAPPEQIAEAIEGAYSPEVAAASLLSRVGSKLGEVADVEFEATEVEQHEEISEADTSAGPIVRLTNLVLHEAIARGASDIHIQPTAGSGVVRFRTDGVLRSGMQMPLPVLVRVVSRIKIMSRLDIADRLRPQDGRARIVVGGRKYDLRVSTVPVRGAEKAVIRILDTQGTGNLEDTGIDQADVARIRQVLTMRDGIFVVTGPTGSGKTTTLYGALREISTEDVNIMTVEDPVEYELPGLTQIQVEPKQGVTFGSALRAILRQDPDVIFVGEIRDAETAEIAAQASLTGHLVLASLHTNDALGSLRRFVDLGLDVGTICETLRGAVAQRLVRQVCSHCVEHVTGDLRPDEAQLAARFGVSPTVRTKGCPRCVGQGYLGRVPVTEFLSPTPELTRLILGGAPLFELQMQAVADGMRTLLQSALDRVRRGETTLHEVDRVVGSGDAVREAPSTAAPRESAPSAPKAPTPTDARERGRSPGATPRAPRSAAEGGTTGEAAHILVVDDDGTTRMLARSLLDNVGFVVAEASDGSEALARLAKGERFDLMILDLDMPMLGGREVLRAVRQSAATAHLPIVVLTGTPDADADIELMEQGADDYIRKPIDPPRFVMRVRAALRRAAG